MASKISKSKICSIFHDLVSFPLAFLIASFSHQVVRPPVAHTSLKDLLPSINSMVNSNQPGYVTSVIINYQLILECSFVLMAIRRHRRLEVLRGKVNLQSKSTQHCSYFLTFLFA